MKKFISMVMAAAMVVSLVPATAFAANEASFKVVDDKEWTEKEAEELANDDGEIVVAGPQIQIKLKDVDSKLNADKKDKFDITLSFDNIEVTGWDDTTWDSGVKVIRDQQGGAGEKALLNTSVTLEKAKAGADKVKMTIQEGDVDFVEGDIIIITLDNAFYLVKDSEGTVGTVKVGGDFGTSDDMVVAAIVEKGIDVELDDDVADVAEEEVAVLDDIVIEPSAGTNFKAVLKNGDALTLKVSKGFEFANTDREPIGVELADGETYDLGNVVYEEDEITLKYNKDGGLVKTSEITITGIKVEATTAKAGDVATITVKADGVDSKKVEVAKVVDFAVVMSVDEDEDVPVYYSGVNATNAGLTVDDEHEALEVTVEETFAGAWSMHKDFELTLPEGVWVTAVKVDDENGTFGGKTALYTEFEEAYKEGDHTTFVFEKRTFGETASDKAVASGKVGDKHEMTFTLYLVADPGFVGDVVLTLSGDAIDTQEVTIAKFESPVLVKAEQNDLKIDYRYTEVGTDIVVAEAEAGLWAKGLTIGFEVERGDMIQFEDDAVFTVNEGSDMEIDDTTKTDNSGRIFFEVEEESDEEAAVVTISGIELFMQRNIPAGPYDLDMWTGFDGDEAYAYVSQRLFAADCENGEYDVDEEDCTASTDAKDHECFVGDVCDYSTTAKEAWINVVTAGREADDASFTTKVVVPVGEAYIIAGETQVALDVPAYVNAAGYTMLPVRAVAVALGINTQNVLWDQATKTVTILYGQRIITMQVGAKVVYVNGSAIPASASVEIVDGRTFLPMRDLATALGVTDITWDAATKTATLNGNA